MFSVVIIAFFVLVTLPAFVLMVRSLGRKIEKSTEEASVNMFIIGAFYVGMIVCLILLGFRLNSLGIRGGEPLHMYAVTGSVIDAYAPLSHHYFPTVMTLLILGVIAYGLLSKLTERLSPVIYVICCALLISNIVFTVIYITHTGFSHYGNSLDVGASILLLQTGYLALSFLYIAKLKDSLDDFLINEQEKRGKHYNNSLERLHIFSMKYLKMPMIWSISLFPIIIVIQLILILFGQRPDSFIRVFLDTSSFNYSSMQAPQPELIEGDGHYLCTVSVRGHKRLVKPLRAGVRHGGRIIVNRQLLIANAFENLLEEHTPNGHKRIRNFYNKYGYPISKHIHSPWSADLIYLLMKPLEWFFLFVLYAVDRNPENRIYIQYSELRK